MQSVSCIPCVSFTSPPAKSLPSPVLPQPPSSNHNYSLKRLYFCIKLKGLYLVPPLWVRTASLTLSISINQQLLLTCTPQFSHQSPAAQSENRGNICLVKSRASVCTDGNANTPTHTDTRAHAHTRVRTRTHTNKQENPLGHQNRCQITAETWSEFVSGLTFTEGSTLLARGTSRQGQKKRSNTLHSSVYFSACVLQACAEPIMACNLRGSTQMCV